MGTTSPPPAAVVAGEPTVAAGPSVGAARSLALLLAYGLSHPRRDRAGRSNCRDRHRFGGHAAELAFGSDRIPPGNSAGRARHDGPAARDIRRGGTARNPSLLAADGQPDRRRGK